MYALPYLSLWCLTLIVFLHSDTAVAPAPPAAGIKRLRPLAPITSAPFPSMIAPTGSASILFSATPTPSASSPPLPTKFDQSALGGIPSGLRTFVTENLVSKSGCESGCIADANLGVFPVGFIIMVAYPD